MTQKTLGYIELEWTCPKCGTRNPGSARSCTACGAPQPADVQFEQRQGQTLVTDDSTLQKANQGADIHCPYCGTRNPASARICQKCGGDLEEGLKRVSGTVVGAYQVEAAPAAPILCPNCGTSNPGTAPVCSACGARLIVPQSTPTAAAAPGTSRRRPPVVLIAGGVILGVCLLGVILLLVFTLFRRDSRLGQVAQVEWSRSIAVEEFSDVTRQDWEDQLPSGAQINSCDLRFHHSQPDSAANAKEVCGTPYTKDTGSGYGQVVQDCVYEVYQNYCSYTIADWHPVDQVELTGYDLKPVWPQPELSSIQRLGDQQESYEVVFQTDQGNLVYHTSDGGLFNNFTPGSQWVLTVNGLGQVVGVQPQ